MSQTGTRETIDMFRSQLLKEMRRFGQRNHMMNVPKSGGMFLRLLVECSRAESVLEIGSSNGYSTIWLAMGLEERGGKLITIEIDAGRASMCRENIKKAGLERIVTILEGDAFTIIPTLEGPFDFVFLDAWKADYAGFLNLVMPKVSPGGLIVAHNVIWKGILMKDFLRTIRKDPRLQTAIVRTSLLGDGFSVTLKRRQ